MKRENAAFAARLEVLERVGAGLLVLVVGGLLVVVGLLGIVILWRRITSLAQRV